MKDDERRLLIALAAVAHQPITAREMPYEVAERLGMNHKRFEYLCDKWKRRNWYECGVSNRCGWLEPDGIAAARQLTGG